MEDIINTVDMAAMDIMADIEIIWGIMREVMEEETRMKEEEMSRIEGNNGEEFESRDRCQCNQSID